MKYSLWSFTCAVLLACTSSCGGPATGDGGAGTGAAAGGTTTGGAGGGLATGGDISDLPCDSMGGCVRGNVDLSLACTAPDGGSGSKTWDAAMQVQSDGTDQMGSCGVNNGLLQLDFGLLTEEQGRLRIRGSFHGGGHYTLAGPDNLQNNGLMVRAKGVLGDPEKITDADTSYDCSGTCELDVLPHDQPVGAPGSWVTYRFVVSCDEPIGALNFQCATCTLSPQTFVLDAACYFVPEGL